MLVYGRRKTGKSFLVTNFIHYDDYFFVKTNKSIITNRNYTVSFDTFVELLKRSLDESKTVVVDEFQRLGPDFFDFLHSSKKQGRLILISSTLYLSTKFFSSKSPLLGLLAEIPIGLIKIEDALRAISQFSLPKKERLEAAILLSEPIVIDYFDETRPPRDLLANMLSSSMKTIPALIGEIFFEEERALSAIYEGILRGIATGNVGSGELSSYLFSKKLTAKDDPSIIQQYLVNLVQVGILRRIEIFNKKRFIYKHTSPLSRIFYYADEKYNVSERKLLPAEIVPIIDEIMPKLVEDLVREAVARKHGLRESIVTASDHDVDALLLKFKKPEIAIEVKWGIIHAPDVKRSEEILGRVEATRKILFVPDKKGLKSTLEIWDVDDLA
nr:AAA family ATPase [Candidatus Sigynarchaeum springense]